MTDIDATLDSVAPVSLPPLRSLVSRFRRGLLLSAALRRVMLTLAILGVLVGPMVGRRTEGTLLFVALAGAWVYLGGRSVRDSRLAAEAPSLIRAERFTLAEQQLAGALASFSLFSGVKLMSVHHLALLRHTQRRWQDCIELCRALLTQSDRALGPLSRSTRLMLADALVHAGDVADAYPHLALLYNERLNLTETLQLLQIQLDYESRLSAWPSMVRNLRGKVALAEIMPTRSAALTHACLALATLKLNHLAWSAWLRRRAELLVDPKVLIGDRPFLAELWAVE